MLTEVQVCNMASVSDSVYVVCSCDFKVKVEVVCCFQHLDPPMKLDTVTC